MQFQFINCTQRQTWYNWPSYYRQTKKNFKSQAGCSSLENFVVNVGNSKLIRAAEGALCFHTVRHHQSYKSMDCTTKLKKVVYNDSAIINNVLAPHSLEKICQDLKFISHIGVATDSSNHAALKMFPIVIQNCYTCYLHQTRHPKLYLI